MGVPSKINAHNSQSTLELSVVTSVRKKAVYRQLQVSNKVCDDRVPEEPSKIGLTNCEVTLMYVTLVSEDCELWIRNGSCITVASGQYYRQSRMPAKWPRKNGGQPSRAEG
jgi:hypothetical protein